MPSKDKAPVDGYSREEFQGGLDALESSSIPYEPRSIEREENKEWQILRAAATAEERSTIEKIDRLYTNARREAVEEDKERDGKRIAAELLPRIKEMKKNTEETLKHIGDNPPPLVVSLGRAVITEAEAAGRITAKEPRSRLGEVVIEIFMRIQELYRRFREVVGSFFASDRYGNDSGTQGT